MQVEGAKTFRLSVQTCSKHHSLVVETASVNRFFGFRKSKDMRLP